MSKRILRGRYKINQLDGGWRRGSMVAGQRIKLNDGDWLEYIECQTPLKLTTTDGLPIFIAPTAPCAYRFDPWSMARTFDVRRA